MAGIIKSTGRNEPAAKSVLKAFHFQDVGQSYLDRVRTEAARLVSEARQEANQIKTKATEEGRQAGIQAAQASLRAQLDDTAMGGVAQAIIR